VHRPQWSVVIAGPFNMSEHPKKFYAQNQKLSFSALTDSVDTFRLKPAIDVHVNKRIA